MASPIIPLEDFFEDVIGKAQRGLGIEDGVLSFITGVPEERIAAMKDGEVDEANATALCSTLGLDAASLIAMGKKEWAPAPVELEGLVQVHSMYDDMGVNAYLAWDAASGSAAIFDSGADASGLIAVVKEHGLKVEAIFLTHTHHDHIIELGRLLAELDGPPPAYVSVREPIADASSIEPGATFEVGALKISTRGTTGHSIGGITYVIEGLAKPVAIVGDALFSSSMGGGVVSFPEALATNRKELFTLSDDTVVCPGHGPMTTIGEEKAHNPFYPEFK